MRNILKKKAQEQRRNFAYGYFFSLNYKNLLNDLGETNKSTFEWYLLKLDNKL